MTKEEAGGEFFLCATASKPMASVDSGIFWFLNQVVCFFLLCLSFFPTLFVYLFFEPGLYSDSIDCAVGIVEFFADTRVGRVAGLSWVDGTPLLCCSFWGRA